MNPQDNEHTDYLAWTIVVGFFSLIVLLVFRPLPEGSSDAVLVLVGQASAGFAAVYAYRYGSTQSAKVKDQTITAMLPTPTNPPAPAAPPPGQP